MSARSYFAAIFPVNETKLLLGGVRHHESSKFESQDDAGDWLRQAIDTNVKAGRMCIGWVYGSMREPEIRARKAADHE